MTEKKDPVSPVFSQMATLTLPDLNAVAGVECGVAMLFPPVKNVGWLSHNPGEPSGIFKGDEPGSRRAYRSGNSSAHDSGAWLAWAVPRAGEKPAGGRAVMATTESRETVEADIVPPCRRDRGQLCLTELSFKQ